jgi:cytochrome b pre-mRNA-processing protein 3
MLNLLGKSAARREQGRALEQQLAARALAAVFFTRFGVPDTMDGRFDMMALHAWLALARLKSSGQDEAAQALTDALFVGFDEALREQGINDMGMGRRMKVLANAFYGRLSVYDAAKTHEHLAEALARNVWRGAAVDEKARALAAYAEGARTALANAPAGTLDFGLLPLASSGKAIGHEKTASSSEAAGHKK